MKPMRIALHSLILVFADIAGIAVGAWVAFKVTGASNQVWLQLPVSVVLCLFIFLSWAMALRVLGLERVQLAHSAELLVCLAAALLWAPLVFVPLHYFTQGYLTSVGNLVALACYQVPVNGLALSAAWRLQRFHRQEGSPAAISARSQAGRMEGAD